MCHSGKRPVTLVTYCGSMRPPLITWREDTQPNICLKRERLQSHSMPQTPPCVTAGQAMQLHQCHAACLTWDHPHDACRAESQYGQHAGTEEGLFVPYWQQPGHTRMHMQESTPRPVNQSTNCPINIPRRYVCATNAHAKHAAPPGRQVSWSTRLAVVMQSCHRGRLHKP